MQPGEVSLAHRGLLFLDEMGEFDARVLDQLRQPLEEGVIRVARASAKVAFPARFLLVGAMNPCPCGLGGAAGACRCSPSARARYARRVSGPLLDRFDLRVEVGRPDVEDLLASVSGEHSRAVSARVAAARRRAAARGVATNADIPAWRLDDDAPLDLASTRLLERALSAGRLSGRGLGGVRRVARTVADITAADEPLDTPLTAEHVSTALVLRAEPSFVAGQAA
jgi:magnesium chelatase family protein